MPAAAAISPGEVAGQDRMHRDMSPLGEQPMAPRGEHPMARPHLDATWLCLASLTLALLL